MNPTVSIPQVSVHAVWFDDLIAGLRTHQLQLETDTAPQEMRTFYSALMKDDADEIWKFNKAAAQKHFVMKIIVEFLDILDKDLPAKLAFDYNDSEVLVWSEIEDNNEDQERKLIRAESKINAAFHEYGFDMETMIVEQCDNLPIPNHYRIYKS